MSDKKITELPDGGAVQSTDEFVAARAGGNVKIAGSAIGGSSSPPILYTGTDPLVDQVTIKAAADQDGATYILKIEDSDGNLLAGFDFGGTLDAVQGFRAGSLDPTQPSATFANGLLQFAATAFQAALRIIKVGGGDMFAVDPSASSAGLVQINTQANNQIGIVLNSFGGTADAFQYYGPPDFAGEFRILADGGLVAALPTSDPHVAGQLWNSSGVVHVSAG